MSEPENSEAKPGPSSFLGSEPESTLVAERTARIDGDLLDGLDEDARLQSSIPRSQQTIDLDFIQMTGLTRPPATNTIEDSDPRHSLNYYPPGGADLGVFPKLPAPPMTEREPEQSPPVSPAAAGAALPEEMRPVDADSFDELLKSSDIDRALTDAIRIPHPEDQDRQPTQRVPPGAVTQRLAEAEQLLHELEQQHRENLPPPTPDSSAKRLPFTAPLEIRWPRPPGPGANAPAAETETTDAVASGRPASREPRPRRRRWRLGFLAVFLAVLAAGGVVAYRTLARPVIASPEQAISEAQRLAAGGKYEDAARAFQRFAEQHPGHPFRPEAQYEAAFALHLAPGASRDAARTLREESLAQFKQFVADNPGHAKRPRAECMMGILCFDLGDYPNAISLLREPARQMDDPDAALPVLRTLARACRMNGNVAEAEAAYLQAAALLGNYSPDTDYGELGEMFSTQAEKASGPEERRRYQRQALEYWEQAVRIPQMDPGARDALARQLDRLKAEMGIEQNRRWNLDKYQQAHALVTNTLADVQRQLSAAETAESEFKQKMGFQGMGNLDDEMAKRHQELKEAQATREGILANLEQMDARLKENAAQLPAALSQVTGNVLDRLFQELDALLQKQPSMNTVDQSAFAGLGDLADEIAEKQKTILDALRKLDAGEAGGSTVWRQRQELYRQRIELRLRLTEIEIRAAALEGMLRGITPQIPELASQNLEYERLAQETKRLRDRLDTLRQREWELRGVISQGGSQLERFDPVSKATVVPRTRGDMLPWQDYPGQDPV
jgi:tetratricopeptide (TPR) repeat protein